MQFADLRKTAKEKDMGFHSGKHTSYHEANGQSWAEYDEPGNAKGAAIHVSSHEENERRNASYDAEERYSKEVWRRRPLEKEIKAYACSIRTELQNQGFKINSRFDSWIAGFGELAREALQTRYPRTWDLIKTPSGEVIYEDWFYWGFWNYDYSDVPLQDYGAMSIEKEATAHQV